MDKLFEIRQINRDEVNYLVRRLENFEKDKAIESGLQSAGNVFKVGGRSRLRKSMKSGSRGVTGNLARSFIVRVKRSMPGVLIGFRQGKGGGSHAPLVDKGTDKRYWKTKSKKYVGIAPANRFWSDTESQDYPKAMNELYNGIEKAANRITERR